MRIGPFQLQSNVLLAPMAGITDRPFRQICRGFGAGLTVSEMITSDRALWHTPKSRLRMDRIGEPAPRAVQIAGADPWMLAEAARFNVERGAQIVDINMGCPAKKVCRAMAGSALLRDEVLVGRILEAVVKAVPVPVTLKMRTGWAPEERNGRRVARIAEESGVQALAVHGRTRACLYGGHAEYDTIAAIKAERAIPVVANGDILTPHEAIRVLKYTGADGVMIGRGAQGRPWIFREVQRFLETGEVAPPPSPEEIRNTVLAHLTGIHEFYGEVAGVRMARKHVGWYARRCPGGEEFRRGFNRLWTAGEQRTSAWEFFGGLTKRGEMAA